MRLIYDVALEISLDSLDYISDETTNHWPYVSLKDVLKKINDAPTIDAVPVVRCKDCLHYRPMVAFDGECMCDVFDWKAEPMDYCSFAERKEVQ